MEWIWLGIAIIAEVFGATGLKLTKGGKRLWPLSIVIPGYASSLYLMSLTLKTIPVGMMYAIWTGAGTGLLVLLDRYFFNQKLNGLAMIGIAMIVSGVAIIHFL